MPAEALLTILALAIVALTGMAGLLLAALLGHGPLVGRLVEPERRLTGSGTAPNDVAEQRTGGPLPSRAPVRLVVREPRSGVGGDKVRRLMRPSDKELDDILAGSLAGEAYNKTVRVLVWAFILSVSVIVSATELWKPVQPQIFVTLALAGIFVLVVHEIMPPGGLGPIRFMLEGTAAIVFLTMLVVLTGKSESPFFLLYPVLVGGAALVAAPGITLLLTFEATIAYLLAAVTQPITETTAPEVLARVSINVTSLVLLAYAGLVVSRVQGKTRDAAVRLSTVDALTDLYNRAYFFTAVDREIQRSRRFRRNFCLLMMDLDGLKAVNDRFGHYEGDLVLRGVAGVIKAGLRGIDIASRYGGDEFVALLPETEPAGAYVVAEKIRQGVTELVIEAGGQQIAASLSIGVVTYPDDGQTADELMIAADEAMYSSKRLGKNRVVGFAEPGSVLAQRAEPSRAEPQRPEPQRAETQRAETGRNEPGSYRPPSVPTPGFRPLRRNGDREDS